MTVYLPPPAHVEAAAQIVEDWIKGQEAAVRVDDAMNVVREWLQGIVPFRPRTDRTDRIPR
jgi:hypothetical protein